MKTSVLPGFIVFALLACASGSTAFGGPVVLSSSLSFDASGRAGANAPWGGGGQSYDLHETTSIPAGTFSKTVSGRADWSIPLQPGWTLPSTAHADSAARATTQLMTSATGLALTLTGGVSANISSFVGYPIMYEGANAAASFGLQFVIDQTSVFSFDLNYDAFIGHGAYQWLSSPTFSFSSATEGSVPGVAVVRTGLSNWSSSVTGVLAPGTYTIQLHSSAGVSGDPLGDFESASYRMNFTTTYQNAPVIGIPDTGNALCLFAPVATLLVLARSRERRLRPSRVHPPRSRRG